MAHTGHDEPAATVTPYEDGPLLLRGDFQLRTPDGEIIESGRGTVALCRCGKSAIKPFCDGTHKLLGFRAGARPDPAPDGQGRLRATGHPPAGVGG
ncbi:CDGSH iron-sulfur domain-containing protein [Micromonospora sp. NPDC047074]|uniref:CDGSH iron-sulfur domain-containing protein n=1 Tax=Micromonospora sp. NPDC047074 TaxID=3154339 RepID=UPI0033CBA961